jgi:hypothetical protein
MTMPAKDKPLEGNIIEPPKNVGNNNGITTREAIAALKDLVGLVGGILASANEQATKRQQFRTYEVTEVARIKALEGTVRHYFDLEFAGKTAAHNALSAAMNRALENGDNEALHTAITGIVDLAKHSSLAAAGDLSKLSAAFADPNTPFDL